MTEEMRELKNQPIKSSSEVKKQSSFYRRSTNHNIKKEFNLVGQTAGDVTQSSLTYHGTGETCVEKWRKPKA